MDRCRISIRAVPNSRSAEVVGRHGDAWKVRVRAAPEAGKANTELERLLSRLLGLPRGSVRVVAGGGSRDKVLEIDGLGAEQVDALLASTTT